MPEEFSKQKDEEPRTVLDVLLYTAVGTVSLTAAAAVVYGAVSPIAPDHDTELNSLQAVGFNVAEMPSPWNRAIQTHDAKGDRFRVILNLGKCPLPADAKPKIAENGDITGVQDVAIVIEGVRSTVVKNHVELKAKFGPDPCTALHLTGDPANATAR